MKNKNSKKKVTQQEKTLLDRMCEKMDQTIDKKTDLVKNSSSEESDHEEADPRDQYDSMFVSQIQPDDTDSDTANDDQEVVKPAYGSVNVSQIQPDDTDTEDSNDNDNDNDYNDNAESTDDSDSGEGHDYTNKMKKNKKTSRGDETNTTSKQKQKRIKNRRKSSTTRDRRRRSTTAVRKPIRKSKNDKHKKGDNKAGNTETDARKRGGKSNVKVGKKRQDTRQNSKNSKQGKRKPQSDAFTNLRRLIKQYISLSVGGGNRGLVDRYTSKAYIEVIGDLRHLREMLSHYSDTPITYEMFKRIVK